MKQQRVRRKKTFGLFVFFLIHSSAGKPTSSGVGVSKLMILAQQFQNGMPTVEHYLLLVIQVKNCTMEKLAKMGNGAMLPMTALPGILETM